MSDKSKNEIIFAVVAMSICIIIIQFVSMNVIVLQINSDMYSIKSQLYSGFYEANSPYADANWAIDRAKIFLDENDVSLVDIGYRWGGNRLTAMSPFWYSTNYGNHTFNVEISLLNTTFANCYVRDISGFTYCQLTDEGGELFDKYGGSQPAY